MTCGIVLVKLREGGIILEYFFAELDCEQVRDILVISRRKTADNGIAEQRVFMNQDGVFCFDANVEETASRVIRLPFVKVWAFCSMIKDDLEEKDETWEIMARDRLGRRYKAEGYAVFNDVTPKYDPSRYLRRVTGIDRMWLLDGKA